MVAITVCTVFALLLADRLFPLPLPKDDLARVVLAEDGSPLYRFADAQGVWRYPVTLDQVSPYYVDALLTYEDRWFYQHPGINPVALWRAFRQNLASGRVISGGSTLSMQVARLIEPHSRTYWGKLRQIARTLQLEWHLSKQEILTLYLNRAPFGGTLQGVAAASWTYLGKPASELTPAEAALMAVLPQAPSRLRPDRHPERAQAARDKVLMRLQQYRVWSPQMIQEALEESVILPPRREPSLAPLLARRLNVQAPPVIPTTLDAGLQQRLEDLLLGWRSRLPERTSAAILVVESESMKVRAYLGSVDLNDSRRFGHVDMIQAQRSPGSTLKPFLYALALDAGLIHSESLLQDVPRRYGDYRPGNFAMDFSGPVSVSEALGRSLNLPAVQLLEAYGPKRMTGELRQAGLPLAFPRLAEPNLALILGGTGTRLEHLLVGFSAFARQGNTAALRFQPADPLVEKPLMSPGAAWIVRRIMAGQSRPDRDPRAQLVQRPVLAWKTGTSYGFRDAWSIGVGPRYLIGVWIGRPDGTPVPGQFGLASAAPLMLQVHDILSNREGQPASQRQDTQPASVDTAPICWPLGQTLDRRDPNCRRLRFAWTLNGTVPPTLAAADQSIGLLQRFRVNEKGERIAAQCPAAAEISVAFWPAPLEPWLMSRERRSSRLPPTSLHCPPQEWPASEPLTIVGVHHNDRLRRPGASKDALTLRFSALGGMGTRWWFLNGVPIAESDESDSVDYVLKRTGHYQLSVLDASGKTGRVEFDFID